MQAPAPPVRLPFKLTRDQGVGTEPGQQQGGGGALMVPEAEAARANAEARTLRLELSNREASFTKIFAPPQLAAPPASPAARASQQPSVPLPLTSPAGGGARAAVSLSRSGSASSRR